MKISWMALSRLMKPISGVHLRICTLRTERHVKNEIKPIPAPDEKIAQSIFFAADKKMPKG